MKTNRKISVHRVLKRRSKSHSMFLFFSYCWVCNIENEKKGKFYDDAFYDVAIIHTPCMFVKALRMHKICASMDELFFVIICTNKNVNALPKLAMTLASRHTFFYFFIQTNYKL